MANGRELPVTNLLMLPAVDCPTSDLKRDGMKKRLLENRMLFPLFGANSSIYYRHGSSREACGPA